MQINKDNKVYDSFRADVIKEIKEEKKYNGWSNYETWVFKLWIDNDQQLYNHVYEWCSRCYEYKIAEKLEDLAGTMTTTTNVSDSVGLASDLLGRALKRINYFELAEVMVQDYKNELNHESNDKEVI